MSSNNSLSKIPITVEAPKVSYRLHWQRRTLQLSTLVFFLIIPISGLFRIDPVAGAFVVLDRQIWWSDFFIVFGLWILFASGLVMMYSTLGTAFCGWSCPQNSLSEWANLMTRKLLGRRAEVSLSGEKMKVSNIKNKLINWVVLGMVLLLTAMLFALLPMFYFYTPGEMLSFVTFHHDERLASSLHYIYFVFVLVVFLDVAFIRHFFCRFMCVYKVWQHGFKTKQTLHVAFDTARAVECGKCTACVSACFLDLDPRRTDIYDSCINCGECITACNNLHARVEGKAGLLKFEIGPREKGKLALFRTNLGSLSVRTKWTIPFAMLGFGMFVSGLWSYNLHHITAYRADTAQVGGVQDYRITLSNKSYHPATFWLSVEGLPKDNYTISKTTVDFASVGRKDVFLHVNGELPSGLHTVLIRVSADDGWQDTFRIQHFVERGQAHG